MAVEPTKPTLRRYGLSLEEWQVMNTQQGGLCYVCHQLPKSGRLHIDHEHVKKWKKLPPDQRKRYVRGLLCFRCNTSFVGRGVTVDRARNVVSYLENYTSRLSGSSPTET